MLHNLIRLARHDVRVHVRRRVVHIPVRQTALRPVATVATEQGKDAHRFPCHVKVIFLSCRRFYHNFFCLCRMCLPFPSSWKILVIPDTSEGEPSEPPFFIAGEYLPRSPSLLTQQQQAVYKKGSPRSTCSRASQGWTQTSTTNRTSTRRHGSHRTGQLQRSYC